MSSRKSMKKKVSMKQKREQKILDAAIEIAAEGGLDSIDGAEIAKRTGVKQGTLHYAYGSMGKLKAAVKARAKEDGSYDQIMNPLLLNRKRASPTSRRRQLLAVAVLLAKQEHYQLVSREDIAEKAGVSAALVTKCFGTMPQLRRDIIRAAIRNDVREVVAQAIASGDPRARKLPEKEKARALSVLVTA